METSGGDGVQAVLSGYDLRGQDLRGANLAAAKLDCCVLAHASAVGAELAMADLAV